MQNRNESIQNPLVLVIEISKGVSINLLQMSEVILQKTNIMGQDKPKVVLNYIFHMNNGNSRRSIDFISEKEAKDWIQDLFTYVGFRFCSLATDYEI